MKLLLIFLLPFLFVTENSWHNNMDDAKQIAKQEHKYILLNFSGSDWCGPCISMHKEIFDGAAFQQFAVDNLVLVNADFPRLKKHQLPAAQQKINDAIAAQYNPNGIFPYTILLNENGKQLKDWEGFSGGSPRSFVEELKSKMDNYK
jgi:thioredoxin-related protein